MSKKIVILDYIYLAQASPIILCYWNNYYKAGKIVDIFLVKPVIENKYFLGKLIHSETIGYVEAITGQPVCDTMCYYDEYGKLTDSVNYDAVSRRIKVGDVCWQISDGLEAKYILYSEEYERLLNENPDNIMKRINRVRNYCRECVKVDSLQDAMLIRKY